MPDRAYLEPRSAYIHVPFCAHRCGYCNFTLIAGRDDLIEGYLDALARELGRLEHPRPVDTLFLGGGTPTHLPPEQLERLLRLVGRWFELSAGGEFSVEANPIDVSAERVARLAAAGVNRLSLGAQSFSVDKLRVLERDHKADDIPRAVELARSAFDSVSLDLIFAAPGETPADWRRDLDEALRLVPDHVSTYGLTYEKGTSYWSRRDRGELANLPEETERAMYEAAIDALTGAGYEHYEVSNFAQPGRRCRHNEIYWLGGTFYAAGPGAAGFERGERRINHRSTTTWMRRVLAGEDAVAERETLSPEERLRERLVFGLRRIEGVDLAALSEEFGLDTIALIQTPLEKLLRHELISIDTAQLRLTRSGLMVSDAVVAEFL